MAHVRLFASLRELAGRDRDEILAATLADLVEEARRRYGPEFARALDYASVTVNGERVPEGLAGETPIGPEDEVALLPPVSGGDTP